MEQIWDLISEYVFYVIGLLILGGLYLLLGFVTKKIKDKLIPIYYKITNKINTTTLISSAETYTKILNELISLRTKMDADRAYIFQFHNGEHFGTANPRWKMSQTYETCCEGTTYEGKNLQNMDVTLFWDVVQIFYNIIDKMNIPGISTFKNNLSCSLEDCKSPKQIYIIEVDKMDGNRGYTKSLFAQQGIKYLMLCPIVSINNEPIGFIGIDYCSEEAIQNVIMNEEFDPCLLCKTGTNVALSWALDPSLRRKGMLYNGKYLKK